MLFIVPILGFLSYFATPFVGFVLGALVNKQLRDRSALLAWIPVCFLFSWQAIDAYRFWSPSWSNMTHWQAVKNSLFGPNCSAEECLGTVFTALLAGGIGYSGGAYSVLRLSDGEKEAVDSK